MKNILFTRRFNAFDAVCISVVADALSDHRFFTALAVFVVGGLISVYMERRCS